MDILYDKQANSCHLNIEFLIFNLFKGPPGSSEVSMFERRTLAHDPAILRSGLASRRCLSAANLDRDFVILVIARPLLALI